MTRQCRRTGHPVQRALLCVVGPARGGMRTPGEWEEERRPRRMARRRTRRARAWDSCSCGSGRWRPFGSWPFGRGSRAGRDVKGERAGPEFRLGGAKGCREGVRGCAGRTRAESRHTRDGGECGMLKVAPLSCVGKGEAALCGARTMTEPKTLGGFRLPQF